MRIWLVAAAAALCCGAASPPYSVVVPASGTDPTVGVLPSYNDTYANWKNAGLALIGGIPNRTTQCGATIAPSGKIPPIANDDAAVINAAITACPAGQVVKLGAGTFQLDQSEYLALNKSITLRGNGPGSTIVNSRNGAIADWTISASATGANCGVTPASASGCTAAAGVILMSPSANYDWGWAGCFLGSTPSCGTLLATDVAQGATTVQVASTTNFAIGMWVLIDENPRVVSTVSPTGGGSVLASSDFLSSSGAPATMRLAGGDIPDAYSFNPNRVNAEIHLIQSIGAGPCPGTACTLTFDDPLTLAFRQSGSHGGRVYWPTVQGPTANPFLQQAGVESLTITKAGNGAIEITFCAYCWVKNVEVGGWIAGAVNLDYAVRAQVEFNYFHDADDPENNGAEYPIGISSASTESLVENNIVVRGGKGMVGRAANTAVVAYNYVDDTFYMSSSIGDYWLDMDINGSHYAGTHHFLFEGNLGDNCDGDETHGNAIYHTFFRNQCTGIRATFTDPSNGKVVNDSINQAWGSGGVAATPGPQRAAGPMGWNYWYGYVGNVLGLSGVTTTTRGWVYSCAFVGGGPSVGQGNACIWMSGWVGGEGTQADPHLQNGAYIFRHGNYDYVNASIVDWAAGYSQALPSSFYLTAKPAFFSAGVCTYPWPWVTPNGSSPIQQNSCGGSGLPAKARFEAGTPFAQP